MRRGKEGAERLHAKFHLNVFIVSDSGGQKPQFWANFDQISVLGVLCPYRCTDGSEIWRGGGDLGEKDLKIGL